MRIYLIAHLPHKSRFGDNLLVESDKIGISLWLRAVDHIFSEAENGGDHFTVPRTVDLDKFLYLRLSVIGCTLVLMVLPSRSYLENV
jgi:hypothetical protein